MNDLVSSPAAKRPPILFLLTTAFLFSLGVSLVFPVLPFIVLQYVSRPSQGALVIGALGASYALLAFFSAPVLGALSDAYGRRPILLLSLLGSAAGYVIFGIGGSLWVLFLGRGIDGLTAGSTGALFGYLADTIPGKERGKVFGQVGATIGAGFIVGPAIGGALSHVSLSAPMFAAAGVCLLNLLWGAFVLPETLRPERRSTKFGAAQLNPLRQLRGALAYPIVRRLVAVSLLFVLTFTIMQTTMALLGKDALGWGPGQTSTLYIVVGLLDIAAQGFVLPYLLRWLGEKGVAQLGLALGVVGLGCLATLPFLPVAPLLYAGVILFAVGEGIFNASLSALISNAVPEDAQGRVQGGAQAFESLAQTAGPLLGGTLYARLGPGATFGAGAALVLLALGVLTGSRQGRGRAQEAG